MKFKPNSPAAPVPNTQTNLSFQLNLLPTNQLQLSAILAANIQTNFSFQPYLLPTYKPTSAFSHTCCQHTNQLQLSAILAANIQTNFSFQPYLLPTYKPTSAFCHTSKALAATIQTNLSFQPCYQQNTCCHQQTIFIFLLHLLPTEQPKLSSALVTDQPTSSFLLPLLPTKHPKDFCCTCYQQTIFKVFLLHLLPSRATLKLSSALVTDKATSSFCCTCYQQSN